MYLPVRWVILHLSEHHCLHFYTISEGRAFLDLKSLIICAQDIWYLPHAKVLANATLSSSSHKSKHTHGIR